MLINVWLEMIAKCVFKIIIENFQNDLVKTVKKMAII